MTDSDAGDNELKSVWNRIEALQLEFQHVLRDVVDRFDRSVDKSVADRADQLLADHRKTQARLDAAVLALHEERAQQRLEADARFDDAVARLSKRQDDKARELDDRASSVKEEIRKENEGRFEANRREAGNQLGLLKLGFGVFVVIAGAFGYKSFEEVKDTAQQEVHRVVDEKFTNEEAQKAVDKRIDEKFARARDFEARSVAAALVSQAAAWAAPRAPFESNPRAAPRPVAPVNPSALREEAAVLQGAWKATEAPSERQELFGVIAMAACELDNADLADLAIAVLQDDGVNDIDEQQREDLLGCPSLTMFPRSRAYLNSLLRTATPSAKSAVLRGLRDGDTSGLDRGLVDELASKDGAPELRGAAIGLLSVVDSKRAGQVLEGLAQRAGTDDASSDEVQALLDGLGNVEDLQKQETAVAKAFVHCKPKPPDRDVPLPWGQTAVQCGKTDAVFEGTLTQLAQIAEVALRSDVREVPRQELLELLLDETKQWYVLTPPSCSDLPQDVDVPIVGYSDQGWTVQGNSEKQRCTVPFASLDYSKVELILDAGYSN
jgi:hypothetical protein